MTPQDFYKYLAGEVLSEQRTISYRTLARALKVHVNAAKCMLYEFYESENKKKAGTIYATYVLLGTRRRPQPTVINGNHGSNDDEDQPMPSSPPPFPSSMLSSSQQGSHHEQEERNAVPVKTITLVREENLEQMKNEYEAVTSIHIYSVSSHKLQDLVALTDINRELYATYHTKEDPLIHNKTYGIIENPDVRRRKSKRPFVSETVPSKFKAVKDESNAAAAAKSTSQTSAAKKEDPPRPGSSGSTTSAASTKQPTLKRDNSDFFKKAFSKSSVPKLRRQDTKASASGAEDAKATDPNPADDEGESEDEALFLDTGTKKPATSRKRGSDAKKEREDKAAKLRKMMDSDDDDDDEEKEEEERSALPDVEAASGLKKDAPASKSDTVGTEDAEDVTWSDSDTEQQRRKDTGQPPAKTDANVVTAPRRRRGKRKVTKKRTMKDEDGYLVTKEEPVWESFSESEPDVPSRGKPNGARGAMMKIDDDKNNNNNNNNNKHGNQIKSSAGAGGGGKGSTKSGTAGKGGNIMSFFGKK